MEEQTYGIRIRDKIIVAAFIGIIFLILAGNAFVRFILPPIYGYGNYVVQMQEYYMEYSEQYEYWDICTIEYPQIDGIKEDVAKKLNKLMYDTAMDRTYYWHLKPNLRVKIAQNWYHMYCSDVACEVPYHSRYLLSLSYEEIYAPDYVLYHVHTTKRALNVDLITGEQYELEDIIQIDEAFIKSFADKANQKYDALFPEEEEIHDTLFSWFLKNDKEWNKSYEFFPYFYITENKDFVVGISVDPKFLQERPPQNDVYEVFYPAEELMQFQTDSEFWEKYESSESAGEVVECEELHENIWLGKDAGTWGFWEDGIGTLWKQ